MDKKHIDNFFTGKSIAIAGVSADPKKFGNQVYQHLKESDFKTYPINPNHSKIGEDKCYPSINDLPDGIESILLATPKEFTNVSLQQAIDKGFKNIWVQQGSHNETTKELVDKLDANIIFNKCILCFPIQ